MLYDRSFCSNIKCEDKKCFRNQNNYDFGNKYICISDFPECEKFKKLTYEDMKNEV
jgi:hypothetical protein